MFFTRKFFVPRVAILIVILTLFVSTAALAVPTQQKGCQNSNSDRPDCSSLEVSGVCEGELAVFTIRNTGERGNGDMVSSTNYRLVVDGAVVESGAVQLAGGATMQVTYAGGGTVTLYADQQVGHPGNSRPQTTLTCSAPVDPTEVPPTAVPPTAVPPTEVPPTAVPPTEVPPTEVPPTAVPPTAVPPTEVPPTEIPPVETEEVLPTNEPEGPYYDVYSYCEDGGSVFVVTYHGPDMEYPEYYEFTNSEGYGVDGGSFQLVDGDHVTLRVEGGYPYLLLTIGNNVYSIALECQRTFDIQWTCVGDSAVEFAIYNPGDDMYDYSYFSVVAESSGQMIDDGWMGLYSGEWAYRMYTSAYGALTFTFEGNSVTSEVCGEVPATATPTPIPPTPTEIPPTATNPPVVPTTSGLLACQKNNTGRLDCSSLSVTAVCEGSTAVFTITNTGDLGDGNMRAPTEYRLLVGNTLIETGSVLLFGRDSMQVYYTDGGKVTLEADQQIGHPGKSRPRATINCN